LFAAKVRDRGKPIPLLLSERDQVDRWARHVPPAAARLMDRFWPGALTLVLPADPGVHPAVTGGGDTVGVRVPDHPVPRALAALLSTVQMPAGVPVATVAVGKAGAQNAAHLAAQILALSSPKLRAKIRAGRKAMAGAVEKAAKRLS